MSEQPNISDVEALHKALDEVLCFFVLAWGWDYSFVDDGLKALARNRGRFPLTLALALEMDRRGWKDSR